MAPALAGDETTDLKPLRTDLFPGGRSDSPVSAWHENAGIVTLFPATSDGLYLANDKTVPGSSLLPGDRPANARYARIQAIADNVYTLWWRKGKPGGNKGLYFSRSPDGGLGFDPVQQLNSDHGVLARYDLALDGPDRLAVAYLDERHKSYAIYFNASNDAGKTWFEQDLRLDATTYPGGFKAATVNDPQLAFLNGALVATWNDKGVTADKKFSIRVVSRVSKDGGKTWGEVTPVYTDDKYLLAEPVAVADGEHLYLFGILSSGVVAFRTSDGVDWTPLGPLEGSAGSDASQLRVTQNQGFVFVAFSGRDDKNAPFRPRVARFDKRSGAWDGPAQQLASVEPHRLTRTNNPAIAAIGDRTLVLAWEDYGNLRPSVVLNYSVDNGKTWAADRPLAVAEPGAHRDVYPQIVPTGKATAALLFSRYNGDGGNANMSYLRRDLIFDPTTGLNLKPTPPLTEEQQKARLDLLKQRVTEFWGHRIKGETLATYDFFDPYFRARVAKKDFMAGRGGLILFHSAETDSAEISVKRRIAEVKVKYSFSVPKTVVSGEEFEVPPTGDTLPSIWLWMDDNWYMLYKPAMGNAFLQY
jgi:hypothetical protein